MIKLCIRVQQNLTVERAFKNCEVALFWHSKSTPVNTQLNILSILNFLYLIPYHKLNAAATHQFVNAR